MTNQVTRLYVLVVGVLAFFFAWVAVAAHPWAPQAAPDPRLAALAARQHRVQADSVRVQRIVNVRWATYHHRLAVHNAAARAQQVAAQAQHVAAQRAAAQQVAAQTFVPAQPSAAAPAYVPAQPTVRVVNLPPLVVTKVS